MKNLLRLTLTAGLSIVIAWGLSLLPDIKQRAAGTEAEVTVFQEVKPIALSTANLVDWVLGVPMRLELKKVDWNDSILAMDFQVHEDTQFPDDIYLQMMDTVRHGLVETRNVQRVRIRVYEEEPAGGVRRLLTALDAERSKLNEADLVDWRDHESKADRWLVERFQLMHTKRFYERHERINPTR